MIKQKKILAVIPARGGSKGIPQKNIKKLAGKPLIAWTIEEARKSKYIDHLILSSEDKKIIRVAQEWGCETPFVRPAELAQDDSTSVDVILHTIQLLPGFDYIILLQPTSPFRTGEDIDGCIEYCFSHASKSCTSVNVAEKPPSWMYTKDKKSRLSPLFDTINKPINRRQDSAAVYVLNGAIYIVECAWFLSNKTFINENTIGYEMTKESSLDIDFPYQFHIAELLLNERN